MKESVSSRHKDFFHYWNLQNEWFTDEYFLNGLSLTIQVLRYFCFDRYCRVLILATRAGRYEPKIYITVFF